MSVAYTHTISSLILLAQIAHLEDFLERGADHAQYVAVCECLFVEHMRTCIDTSVHPSYLVCGHAEQRRGDKPVQERQGEHGKDELSSYRLPFILADVGLMQLTGIIPMDVADRAMI